MSQKNLIGFVCTKCKTQNYVSTRNKKQVTEKLKPTKYCKVCRARTEHKEFKV